MKIWIALGMAALSTPALGAGFDIHVDNFYLDGDRATVVMKVTNNTGAMAKNVFIDCAFLNKENRAIEIGKAWITTLGAGQYAYDKASAATGDRVQFADCQVVENN